MAENLPLLIFPKFTNAQRDPGKGRGKMPHCPNRAAQDQKLGPKFETLQKAFEAERLAVQEDMQGLAPEFVLVIETRGRIENFQAAARNIGMDWLSEIDLEDLDPDEDFYELDKNDQHSNKKLDGRLYLAMTNQQALAELLRLWTRYRNDQPLGDNNTKWRDLFDYAKDIRLWGAKDRLIDSGILDEWAACSTDDPQATTFFRLELWFKEGEAGNNEEQNTRSLIEKSGGKVTASCRLEDIRFHGLKGMIPVSLAKSALQVKDSDDESLLPALFRRQGIRYFQPIAQGVATLPQETEAFEFTMPPPDQKPPIVALLDGYLFASHDFLNGRLEIHDPDDLLSRYDPREMRHGTAMASLIVNGELDAKETSLSRKIYCRPILEPDLSNRLWHSGVAEIEHIPETSFAEDRIHSAVVEMFEGESPIAQTIRIVNLSVGEQPFYREISPWARLIDWLAYKYKLLFCISAGNQTEDLLIGIDNASFSTLLDDDKIDMTIKSISQRQFNSKLLSPGEAINALTVGSQHMDRSSIPYIGNRIDLFPSTNIFSPLTRLGPGFRHAIKPDILMPGGRQLYRHKMMESGCYEISHASQAPGQKVASPDNTITGKTNQTI